MRSSLVVACCLVALAACGTDPSTTADIDGPGIIIGGDAGGAVDGGGLTLPDGGTAPGADAGTEPSDTGNPTADVTIGRDTGGGGGGDDVTTEPDLLPGQICEPNSTRCADAGVLVTCSETGTAEGRTRCTARDLVCGIGEDGVAACLEEGDVVTPMLCEPGSQICSDDRSLILTCDDAGMEFVPTEECPEGCFEGDGGPACSGPVVDPPPTGCDDPNVEVIEGNIDIEFDLCESDDNYSYATVEGICAFEIDGQDRVFSFTLEEPTNVFLDVRDFDSGAAIDTLINVRTACANNDTQIICADDVACDESDVESPCTGDLQPRQSRIEETFEPGTYYVLIEGLNYRSGRTGTQFGCGNVRFIAEFN